MHYGSFMTTITLKNVPPAVHKKLKTLAKVHGRSLNKEIITTLEYSLHGSRMDSDSIQQHASAVRESMGVYLTQDTLSDMKNAGRK